MYHCTMFEFSANKLQNVGMQMTEITYQNFLKLKRPAVVRVFRQSCSKW